MLLRMPSDEEVAFHVAWLNAGGTRAQLATNFLNTQEFRNGRGPRLTAFLLYATLLFRDPTPAEQQSLENTIKADIPLKTIVKGFFALPEFSTIIN